jgi:uncharacterized YigZ family protein
MTVDQYRMVVSENTGDYKEKGSKFLAYCFPMYQIEELDNILNALKKLHPKARHICYAYRCGFDKTIFRANDDGEPSGTAGKPILGAIDSFNLTNSLVAVVRYFGGTKLGASGLIHAYKISARDALENAQIEIRTITEDYQLSFDYAHMGVVMDAIKKLELEIVKMITEQNPALIIKIPKSEIKKTIKSIKATLMGRKISDIKDDTEVAYLTIHSLNI